MSSKAQVIERRFVVGIDWRRSVQRADLARQALLHARKQRATWYCTCGDHTYGVASLRGKPAKNEHWHALACGFAAMCGYGYGFAVIRLGDGRIWICSATDGAPNAGYDQVVRDASVATNRLQQFLSQINAGSVCGIWTNDLDLLAGIGDGLHQQIHSTDLPAIITAAEDQRPMQPVGTALPKPVLGALIAALFALSAHKGWDYWQTQQRMRAAAAEQAAGYINPAIAWTRAYEALAGKTVVVDHQGLRSLRDAIETLPTSIAGWRLGTAECQAALQDWLCTLMYERTVNAGLDPTNAVFEQLRPRHWQSVQFHTVNLASAHLLVPSRGSALSFQRFQELPTVQQRQLQGTSALQRVLRAFSGHEMTPFVEMVPDVPLDREGKAIAKPVELALAPRKASVTLTGPLRSVDVLVDTAMPYAWRSLKLTIDPIPAHWQSEGRSGLNDSLVKATIVGDVYASR